VRPFKKVVTLNLTPTSEKVENHWIMQVKGRAGLGILCKWAYFSVWWKPWRFTKTKNGVHLQFPGSVKAIGDSRVGKWFEIRL